MYQDEHHHKKHGQPIPFHDVASGDLFTIEASQRHRWRFPDPGFIQAYIKLDPMTFVDHAQRAKTCNARAVHGDHHLFIDGDTMVIRVSEKGD